ncbi:hypothetical protein [Pseudothauera rhizosphaerae]|uniref:Uncharacterized protein n=1 Tax=Pseudothauera rhizosphaerae TaxID=2565932 RepID=A0A4S4AUQ8_9RHOO|nr:hypothetical protein [Pseudothauera rhizosphaerae]THF63260.1 hypothetical protein E6O51_04110 [Pseudothauera rhizosphaerae]
MLPLIPFAAGLLTGLVAVNLLKTNKTRAGLDKAQQRLREATASSLAAIESASARARSKLEASPEAEAAPAVKPTAAPRKAAPKRKPKAKPAAAAPQTGKEAS